MTTVVRRKKLEQLRKLGRTADAVQLIILLTMGQYFYGGGSQQLNAKHWIGFREFMGGYQNVGTSLIIIASIGFVGLISLAMTDNDRIYTILMWTFTVLAITWCLAVASFQTYALLTIDGAGNAGLWTWMMSAFFFLFTRITNMFVNRLEVLEEEKDT